MKRQRDDEYFSGMFESSISENEMLLLQMLCPKEQYEIDKIKKSYKKCKRKTN
jgi:hypothetical protein